MKLSEKLWTAIIICAVFYGMWLSIKTITIYILCDAKVMKQEYCSND